MSRKSDGTFINCTAIIIGGLVILIALAVALCILITLVKLTYYVIVNPISAWGLWG